MNTAMRYELNAVDDAARRLGKSVPPNRRQDESLESWRAVTCARLGLRPQPDMTHTDMLQACGQASGQLYETTTRDRTGREVVSFHGDPAICWQPFRAPTLRAKINMGVFVEDQYVGHHPIKRVSYS